MAISQDSCPALRVPKTLHEVMTVSTQMLPIDPAKDSQTEELDSDDMGKTVKTSYLTFHNHFENVYKRQKISDDLEGKKLYGKFIFIFRKLSHNSVYQSDSLVALTTCALKYYDQENLH